MVVVVVRPHHTSLNKSFPGTLLHVQILRSGARYKTT